MSEIKYIGQMSSSQNSRVIDPEGISYAVTNGHKDGEPKIIERDTPMKGNYTEPRICTMVGRDPNNPSSRARSDHYEQFLEMGDDVSNTLTSVQKDNLLAEPMIQQRAHGFNKGGEHEIAPTMTGSAYHDNNVVVEPDWKTVVGSKQANSFLGDVKGEAPCITSACGAGGGMTPMVTDASLKEANTDDFREQVRGHRNIQYRIRKLTPRECFRLMGVTEADIDKIQQSGVSQSQQYKMAGNSIVVDCLYHMFRKMFTETACESQQLSLF